MPFESVAIVVVERQRVIDSHGGEVADVLGLEPEDVREKLRRCVLVMRGHDRVIQRDAHDAPPFIFRYCSNGRALRPAGQGILFSETVTIRARLYNASRAGSRVKRKRAKAPKSAATLPSRRAARRMR